MANIDLVKLSYLIKSGEKPGTWFLYDLGKHVDGFTRINPKDIQPGDLVVIHPRARKGIPYGHAAIYVSGSLNSWNVINVGNKSVILKNNSWMRGLKDKKFTMIIKNKEYEYNSIKIWRYTGK